MNYILYNNLANNGAGETWADKLLETLGGKVGEGYEKTTLVGYHLSGGRRRNHQSFRQ